ncbi:MAG: heme-binding protein, partial [Gammaproteobacteria bacterium]|nr:heme-binding protein [Gammaproteobacteria bacterium]
HVEGAIMLGGGLLIDAGGATVGAIGVSGAPGGELDDLCAQAGIDAIEEDILF